MDRIRFCELFSEKLYQSLIDHLDRFGHLTETKHFILFNDQDSEDFSIIYKDMLSHVIISWYKLMHLGRGLETTGISSEEELINMLNLLEKDLDEENNRLDKDNIS